MTRGAARRRHRLAAASVAASGAALCLTVAYVWTGAAVAFALVAYAAAALLASLAAAEPSPGRSTVRASRQDRSEQ